MKTLKHILLIILLCSASGLRAQDWELVWSDEFDGNAVDPAKWEFQIGDGCPNLCGWGNNELQYYRAENAVVEDGLLKIIAQRQTFGGRQYTSARMRSLNKGDWTFGRFEARIRLPEGQGIWPAFWMLPTDEVYGGWPRSGEIDIMEMVGHEPSTVHGTIHFGDPWPNNSFTGNSYRLSQGKFSDDFHLFAVEWGVGVIDWYVDGTKFSTKTRNDLQGKKWPFDQQFHLLLNLAVGGNWPGNPDASTEFPQIMEVDYVRVYQLTNITGLGDEIDRDFLVYPVPGKDTLRLLLPDDAHAGNALQISLTAINGVTVKEWSFTSLDAGLSLELDVSETPAGIYLLQVSGYDTVIRKKIALQ